MKAAEKKASDAESEVTNCNKKILQMEEELDSVTEKLNSSITKVTNYFQSKDFLWRSYLHGIFMASKDDILSVLSDQDDD